jgi:hypothetical protein
MNWKFWQKNDNPPRKPPRDSPGLKIYPSLSVVIWSSA